MGQAFFTSTGIGVTGIHDQCLYACRGGSKVLARYDDRSGTHAILSKHPGNPGARGKFNNKQVLALRLLDAGLCNTECDASNRQ